MAVSSLIKLSNYPIIETFLNSLLGCEISINSIDVASKVIKAIKVPNEFVNKYTSSILQQVLELEEGNKDRPKLARVIISFLKTVKRNRLDSEEVEAKL